MNLSLHWPLSRSWRGWVAVVAAALAAVACGGGVGSGGTGSFASGPITGFGSVIVNDVRFDDSNATVEDGDGVRRSRNDLKLGMTVDIDSGVITSGVSGATASATRIRYDSQLRGPVTAVDVAGGGFSVLGQRVTVDVTTVFDEALGGLAALTVGTSVEVFGQFDPAALRYRAKRVSKSDGAAVVQLLGQVNQLDASARTLRIGGATYAYGSASGVPADLAVGQFVRLRVAAVPVSGRFTVLSFGTALPSVPDADGASLKGLITAFSSATVFSVNGRPVDASGASFPDGRSGLAVGVRVEVKGDLRSGLLRATEVRIKTDQQEDDSQFEISGAIDSVNVAAKTFVLRGLTIGTARPDLRYQNGSAANLVAGARCEVKGLLSADRLRIDAVNISFE